jgi:hypothetical protein
LAGGKQRSLAVLPIVPAEMRKDDREEPRGGYKLPASANYGVIPLLGGMMGVFVIAFVGLIDRIPGFGSPASIPLIDLGLYAAIAFVCGFGLLLLKAVIWPWR